VVKRPWLAALLNAWPLPLGIGYLYLRQWARFVLSFLWLQVIAQTVVLMLLGRGELLNLFIAVVWIAVVADGYLLAQRMNRTLEATGAVAPPNEENRASEPQLTSPQVRPVEGPSSAVARDAVTPHRTKRWGLPVLLAVAGSGLVIGATLTALLTDVFRPPARRPVQTVLVQPTKTPIPSPERTPAPAITPTPEPIPSTLEPANTPTITPARPPSDPDPDDEYMTCLSHVADLSEALNRQLDAAWATGDNRETFCQSWLSGNLLENALSAQQLHNSCSAPQHRDLVEARGHLDRALEYRVTSIQLVTNWCIDGSMDDMEGVFEESERYMALANELIAKATSAIQGS
jgi:hypothetical protein